MFEQIAHYLSYPFAQRALAAAVLTAISSSLLGVTLVLKRFSFIGDGLSHVAFGAIAIATVMKIENSMIVVLPVTVLAAVLLLWTGRNRRIRGDAALAMISVGALAFGYLLMNIFSTSSNLSGDVCSTLFGAYSILTLSAADVWVCAVLSFVVIVLFVLLYNKIFAVTFDETFATATGTRANLYNLLIAVIIAVVIVMAMNLVGSLLISALVIFPALSAMRVFKSFRSVTVSSAVISVVCTFIGVMISLIAGTPTGATIVAVDVAAFFGFCAAGWLRDRGAGKGKLSLAMILILAIAISGCGFGDGTSEPFKRASEDRLRIVTTIYPQYDWVLNILKGTPRAAEVTLLMDQGVDLHSYQPTADDILAISACDLFIYVGGESDGWVEKAAEEARNPRLRAVNLLERLGDLAKEEEIPEGMQGYGEENPEEEPEYDEHVWLSLRNAEVLVTGLAKTVAELDPENAEVYEKNAENYCKKLAALDACYEETVAASPTKTLLFGDRFPFRYLTEDYGLTYYAAFAGCSAETEASFETLAFLAEKMDELGLPCVMTIEGGDVRIAETIIESTSAKNQKILTLNSLQSVTDEELAAGEDYLSMMEKNLEVLAEALR